MQDSAGKHQRIEGGETLRVSRGQGPGLQYNRADLNIVEQMDV